MYFIRIILCLLTTKHWQNNILSIFLALYLITYHLSDVTVPSNLASNVLGSKPSASSSTDTKFCSPATFARGSFSYGVTTEFTTNTSSSPESVCKFSLSFPNQSARYQNSVRFHCSMNSCLLMNIHNNTNKILAKLCSHINFRPFIYVTLASYFRSKNSHA